MNPGKASILRLYINSDDTTGGKPLCEAVVKKARELGLAGASVFPAEIGYGAHRIVHDSMSEYSFIGSPLVVEVIDGDDLIQQLLAELNSLVSEGFVTVSTVSPVEIVHYVHGGA